MKRFLSTTAVILAMSGTAYADAHASGFGAVQVQQGDFFASDLIGMRIHNAEGEITTTEAVNADAKAEWDDIGEINDLIVNKDGDVTAVILGVGGFLGIGERDVSVSMDAIKTVMDEDGDRFLVVTTTKEALEAAPEFDRDIEEEMEAVAENAEAETETEEMAENAEATTEEVAEDAEAKTEEMAAEAEAETEEVAENMDGETAIERPLLTRPQVEREGFADADMEMVGKLTAEDLDGSYVYGANDETVGEIDRLLMSDDGKVEQVVINVGGFLGLGEKPVAVTFDELQVLKNVEGDDFRIYIDSTEEALEAQPEFKE